MSNPKERADAAPRVNTAVGPCLRPVDVARKLGISSKTVLRLLRAKKIPGVKLNRLWLVPEEQFAAFLKNLRDRIVDADN